MARRTLYHLCGLKSWREMQQRGYIGWRKREMGGLDSEVAFFTDDPVDKQSWFSNRRREVIVVVSLPEAMVRPFPDFMAYVAASAGDPDGSSEMLALVPHAEHVWATPRTIPTRYWRYAQAVDGHMLWLPVQS